MKNQFYFVCVVQFGQWNYYCLRFLWNYAGNFDLIWFCMWMWLFLVYIMWVLWVRFLCSFTSIDHAVELGYMLAIHWVILPPTFLQDSNACRVTMFYIQWDGMHLDCLQSNMQLRFVFLFWYIWIWCVALLLYLCGPYAHLFIGYYMCPTDRNSPKYHNIKEYQPLSFSGDIMFSFCFLVTLICLKHVFGNE